MASWWVPSERGCGCFVCDLDGGQLRRFFVGVMFLPDARRILFLTRTLPRRDMLSELQSVLVSTKIRSRYHATEHEGGNTRFVQHPCDLVALSP